ncbi:AAA family ATPase [Aeromonas veronii]|uniref:AAA family ATPase n=1 Tax=Aeromonas veronii TaxID=654 RepID=UPI003D1EC475
MSSFDSKPYLRSLKFKNVDAINWHVYPFSIPSVANLEGIEFHSEVTFFVGENGAGKSTVLEAIALALGFSPEGGTKNFSLQTAQTTSDLFKFIRPLRSYKRPKDGYFLRAESFYNVATYMDEVDYLGGYGNKSLHHQSHGESFMALLLNKLKGNGLYLFDEPEAALSPMRQLTALATIHQLAQENSQFIIATHSPILLSYPHAKIIEFSAAGIQNVLYEETEHYRITKDFLNNYQRRIQQLLIE